MRAYLERADQGDASYYRNLAMFFADVRPDPARALEWARKDFEVRQDIYAYDTLAWTLYRSGKFADALDAAIHALEYGTEDATLWRHSALIHEALGNTEAARLHHARAVSIEEVGRLE